MKKSCVERLLNYLKLTARDSVPGTYNMVNKLQAELSVFTSIDKSLFCQKVKRMIN